MFNRVNGRGHNNVSIAQLMTSVLYGTIMILLAVSFSLGQSVHSDSLTLIPTCGTMVSQEDIRFESQKQDDPKSFCFQYFPGVRIQYPISVHIVRAADGRGGISMDQLRIALFNLNAQFNQVDLQFFLFGNVDEILSDDFYQHTDTDEAESTLAHTNVIENTINVYFVSSLRTCGKATLPHGPYKAIWLNDDCSTDISALAHEMGHFFDLYHTHETAFGTDCGLWPCSGRGDLVCDTPPDPNIFGHVDQNCQYDGMVPVPNECPPAMTYNPFTDNIMSYSNPTCKIRFTDGQICRIRQQSDGYFIYLIIHEKYVDENAFSAKVTNNFPVYSSIPDAVIAANRGDNIFIKPAKYVGTLIINKGVSLRNWDEHLGSVIIGK